MRTSHEHNLPLGFRRKLSKRLLKELATWRRAILELLEVTAGFFRRDGTGFRCA